MTDKVQKIREEVEKRYKYWKEKESNSHSIESEIRMSECKHLLLMLDSMQEEPVSEDLEEAVDGYTRKVLERTNCLIGNQPVGEEISKAVKFGAKWQKKADHQ